ncbi:TadE/TadG family type IV pilus assembly protein [Methylobacterium sp. SyP6R]|uniref:TadE/TadG family type IV pilus assembly protein n=1 Tax=Methylobacterium sp. SyP6R TaxID=2718876 RepID=UPI001F2E9F30|nr:TadE/TadG family type IV pilus assembly protein [Methylobacterium sp. SyP6R]MCF4126996.1 pilus assembly protein [Methylobacterium sp. SyP6R]
MPRHRPLDAVGKPAGRVPALCGRIGARVARFPSDREGATAVEFALIAMPFLCLVAAIVETALAFFAGQVLDNAVSSASRQLYTGQFQAARSGDPAPPPDTTAQAVALQKFKDAICHGRVTIFSCSSVKVDVLAMADGSDLTPQSPVDGARRDWRTDFGTHYQNPGSNQIVIVQAAVEFPVFFGFLNPDTLANGRRVLQSTVVFRTEPFQ